SDARYRIAAMRAADYLWRVHRRPDGGLARASNAGVIAEDGVLEDYAALAHGLVTLFEATGEVGLLERALSVVDTANAKLAAPEGMAMMPTVEGKGAKGGAARAFVCVRGTCERPTSDPAILREQLRRGWFR